MIESQSQTVIQPRKKREVVHSKSSLFFMAFINAQDYNAQDYVHGKRTKKIRRKKVGSDRIALETILESDEKGVKRGFKAERLLAGMIDIGVHPTDETGVKRILDYEWPDLFKVRQDVIYWNDDIDSLKIAEAKK